ncbi:hypothetical protein V8C42DRAFT_341347 [Trichoderma barbatum]
MEKRLQEYIDEKVEDLKADLRRIRGRLIVDSATNRELVVQSITNIEAGISEQFIKILGSVEQLQQKMQKDTNQDIATFMAEKLNANKKRSALVAFGMNDSTRTASNAQQPSARLCSSTQNSEINFPPHQMEHEVVCAV